MSSRLALRPGSRSGVSSRVKKASALGAINVSLNIRSARAVDEDAVVALWKACNLVGDKNPAADFQFARLGESSDVLIGVDEADQVKASVMVGHDGHRGWLY